MRSELSMTLFLSSYLHLVVELLYVALFFLSFFLCKKKRKRKEGGKKEQTMRITVLVGIKTIAHD